MALVGASVTAIVATRPHDEVLADPSASTATTFSEPPANAPVGQTAFVRLENDNAQTYVINADGSDQQNISNMAGHDPHPVWSPDGQQVAFSGVQAGGPPYAVHVVNAHGSKLQGMSDTVSVDPT